MNLHHHFRATWYPSQVMPNVRYILPKRATKQWHLKKCIVMINNVHYLIGCCSIITHSTLWIILRNITSTPWERAWQSLKVQAKDRWRNWNATPLKQILEITRRSLCRSILNGKSCAYFLTMQTILNCTTIYTLSHDFLFTCKTLCLMYSKWLGGMKNSLRIFCFTFQQTIVCKEGRLFCILRTGAFHSTFLQKMCQKHQKLCHGHWLKKVVVCSPLFSMTLKVIWPITQYLVFTTNHSPIAWSR